MSRKLERRAVMEPQGIRFRNAGNKGRISGVAARFFNDQRPLETQTVLAEGVVERIHRQAFSNITRDVVALSQHNLDQPLGRVSAGTLRLHVTPLGLEFEVDLPDTTAGRDMQELVSRGDINGASFGFLVRAQKFAKESDLQIRNLMDIDLVEVSPVTLPANAEGTEVSLRCLELDTSGWYRTKATRRVRAMQIDKDAQSY